MVRVNNFFILYLTNYGVFVSTIAVEFFKRERRSGEEKRKGRKGRKVRNDGQERRAGQRNDTWRDGERGGLVSS